MAWDMNYDIDMIRPSRYNVSHDTVKILYRVTTSHEHRCIVSILRTTWYSCYCFTRHDTTVSPSTM